MAPKGKTRNQRKTILRNSLVPGDGRMLENTFRPTKQDKSRIAYIDVVSLYVSSTYVSSLFMFMCLVFLAS